MNKINDNKIKAKKDVTIDIWDIIKAVKEKREIFIVKGSEDARILKSFGYIVISLEDFNIKEEYDFLKGARLMVCGGINKHAKYYAQHLDPYIFEIVEELNVIQIEDLDSYIDMDMAISAWVKNGHTKEEFDKFKEEIHDLKKHEIFKYVTSKNNKLRKEYEPQKIWENLECLLKYNDINLRFNKLYKTIECKGITNNYGHNALRSDIHSLCIKAGLKISIKEASTFIDRIAKKNTYSPVQEYLLECYSKLDVSIDYIDILANTIKEKDEFDEEIKKLYLRKWLLNCVNLAFNDRGLYGSEGVLVFQGKQGIRKTTWIKKLSPNYNWVKTGIELDTKNKDDVINSTKYWLVELGELDATFQNDVKKLRKFITEGKDQYRMPYDREPEEYPRLTNFFGTVNDTQFLKDEAGNRRYWVIPVEKILIEEFNKIDLDKLWGQVMNIWKNNLDNHYFDENELELLNINNKEFEVETHEYCIILDKLDWSAPIDKWIKYKPTDLAAALGIKSFAKLKNALLKKGIEQKKGKDRYYLCPPLIALQNTKIQM